MLTPYIEYVTDYTKVTGTKGMGFKCRTIPVYIGKRAHHFQKMTTEKWRYLCHNTDTEFTINEALAEIGDPKLTGEVNRFRGLADIKDTMDKLLCDAMQCVNEIMREAVVVDSELQKCTKRLEMADAFQQINDRFHQSYPLPVCPRSSPSTLPFLLICANQSKCPCSPIVTAATVQGVLIVTSATPPTTWCQNVPSLARTVAVPFAAMMNIGSADAQPSVPVE
jgi:hypothetical protein